MSILNVEHVTHGFGARQILNDASFRLLKGEHVGLVGAKGEGSGYGIRQPVQARQGAYPDSRTVVCVCVQARV